MALTLPLPVRVAAGLLATGIDVVRSLPTELPAIPVTLVGNALKLSLKVQQEIATLATRGDELLGGVVGAPQENPSWARFDDDPPPPVPAPAATRKVRPAAAPRPADEPAATLTTPEASAMPPGTTTAMNAALEVPDAVVELALVAVDDSNEDEVDGTLDDASDGVVDLAVNPVAPAEEISDTVAEEILLTEAIAAAAEEAALEAEEQPADERSEEVADGILAEAELVEELADDLVGKNPAAAALADEIAGELIEEVIAEEVAEDVDAAGPTVLPGYDGMSLAEVRGHLRQLAAEDVSALLDYEQNGDNRAPFLTLLSNRLVTLDAQLP